MKQSDTLTARFDDIVIVNFVKTNNATFTSLILSKVAMLLIF